MRMKAWWAGHCLIDQEIADVSAAEQKIGELQMMLDVGQMCILTCGVTMAPDALCIDCVNNDRIILQRNIRKS